MITGSTRQEGSCTDRGRTESVARSLGTTPPPDQSETGAARAGRASYKEHYHAQDQDQPGGGEAFSQDRVGQDQVRSRVQVAHPDQEVDQAEAWSPCTEPP